MKDLVPLSLRSGVSDLRDRVAHLLDEWLPDALTGNRYEPVETSETFWRNLATPAVDIVDRAEDIVVKAELPGLEKDDFTVEVEPDRVILRGEKKAEREHKDGACLVHEACYGSFYRALALPDPVDRDKAEATYKHGVLTITLPKTDEAKKRRIKGKDPDPIRIFH